jgi:L-aminopeptidase/D-esterase-like protein
MTDRQRSTPSGKPRARALGIPFDGAPGPWNAITDVAGLEVGYTTLIEGDDVRTGVTAIHPRGKAHPHDPCAAGVHSLNGNGEMTGWVWIEESGLVSLPIAITSTAAVGIAQAGINSWLHTRHPDPNDEWALPVAAETWDGFLHAINDRRITEEEAHAAMDTAATGPIEEGSVGGGTGMNCYGFTGGSGTASRRVPWGTHAYTVGAFVQANFGSRAELTIAGVPVGRELLDDDPLGGDDWIYPPGSGSVIAIIATDAPLLPPQCKALARRVPLGLARTGTTGSHFSGDIFLAFSTANAGQYAKGFPLGTPSDAEIARLDMLPWTRLDDLFAATVQAVEEAVINAIVANEEMHGRQGRRVPALPRDRVVELLRAAGRI